MVAVACPVPTAVQVRPAASSAPSAPNTSAAELLGLGEGLGVVGGLGLVCLVAVDGGLVVGSLALSVSWRASAASARLAQRVAVTGWVGLVHVSLLTEDGERNGCSRTSLTIGAARLG
jgi:hypothetical protein